MSGSRQDQVADMSVRGAASRQDSETRLRAALDALADEVAERVVDRLRAGDFAGYVDQSASPLGRRRHINAIRSGALPGMRVGRRYLARRVDLESFVTRRKPNATPRSPARGSGDSVDQLAAEFGLRRVAR